MLTIFIIDEFMVFFLISSFNHDKQTFDNEKSFIKRIRNRSFKKLQFIVDFLRHFLNNVENIRNKLKKKHFTSKFIIKKIV